MTNSIVSILIVDDESLAIQNLSNLIATYCKSLRILGTASSVEDGIDKINKLKPDAVFLDVNMPKQTGFDLINQLKYTPSIVFVTAHEKHALRAMKVCAVDFLMKPIVISELIEAQTKLLQVKALKPEIRKNFNLVLRNLTAILEKPGSVRKITLYGSNGYEIFNMDDILYLTGEDNYTSFHFLKQKSTLVSKTLKEYEEILEPFGFMRIHKSTLVNLMYIKKIIRNESLDVLMTDGKILNVSRRKSAELLEWSKSLLHAD